MRISADLTVWDDPASYLHTVVGLAAGLVSAERFIYSLPILVAYSVYQLSEQEPQKNKLGDFLEFGAGHIGGYLVGKAHQQVRA